jgi:branched-chain amino acid transport system permease protein
MLLAGIVPLLIVGLFAAQPAAGQETETTAEGTIRSRGTAEDGGDEFYEGVRLVALDASGAQVGEAISDAAGEWVIVLPGAGEYVIELDESTLPEGVPLREGTEPTRAITATEGRASPALFPLGDPAESETTSIRFIQLTVDGLKLGLIIGMTAIGLSLIYGTTGLVNFAHGEIVTMGAMVAFLLNVTGIFGTQIPLIPAGIVAVIFTGLFGGLLNQWVWKPLRDRGSSLISMLVVSIGISIFLRYVLLYLFGGRGRPYRDYQIQRVIDFGPFSLAPKDIFIIVISLVVLISVGLLLQGTRIGKAMRAVADNRDLAESSGIDVEAVIRYVWVAGGALAGLGGVLFGLTEDVGWEMGFRLLLLMFAGVTLGGLGTAYGALVGSLIVGVFIQLSTYVVPNDMKNVGALLALVLILLVRPQGLLGRAERVG